MPDTRVGSLDNPQRYGCRSVAVYENSTGYYYKLDGGREKVHGNQLWTSTAEVKMRGSAPVDDAGRRQHGNDWEEASDWDNEEARQLAAAIAASLQDDGPGDVPMGFEPEGEDAPSAAGAVADDAADASTGESAGGVSGGSRECSICLTEPSVMLMRPCNHVCACQMCSRRLVRHPCPLCRRMVSKVERVYF